MRPWAKHLWRYVPDSGDVWRCTRCFMDRRALPIVGTWRPWPSNCQG